MVYLHSIIAFAIMLLNNNREKPQISCILTSVLICTEITKLERNEAVGLSLKSSQPFHPHHITLNLLAIKFNRNHPLAKTTRNMLKSQWK